jgi:hypothetical protein
VVVGAAGGASVGASAAVGAATAGASVAAGFCGSVVGGGVVGPQAAKIMLIKINELTRVKIFRDIPILLSVKFECF